MMETKPTLLWSLEGSGEWARELGLLTAPGGPGWGCTWILRDTVQGNLYTSQKRGKV